VNQASQPSTSQQSFSGAPSFRATMWHAGFCHLHFIYCKILPFQPKSNISLHQKFRTPQFGLAQRPLELWTSYSSTTLLVIFGSTACNLFYVCPWCNSFFVTVITARLLAQFSLNWSIYQLSYTPIHYITGAAGLEPTYSGSPVASDWPIHCYIIT